LQAALACEFQQSHDVQSALGSDGDGGAPQERIANVGVVVAVIATRRGDAVLFECVSQRSRKDSPILFGFKSPWRVRRNASMPEIVFLRIEGLFNQTALRAEQNEARAQGGGENAGSKNCAHATRVVQRDIERIVSESVFTLDANVGRYSFRQAEEQQGVIDQMGGNIEEDAAARTLRLAPCAVFQLRPVAIISCFETNNSSQGSRSNKLADGLKIAVVTAVLINSQETARRFRELHQ
jgi:hypothetical protein